MDPIIQRAKELSGKAHENLYLPIKGRIAYVVNHGAGYATDGYAIRTQCIAKALIDHGFEVLCFVRQGSPFDLGVKRGSIGVEEVVDGVRYIHSDWPREKTSDDESERLRIAVGRLEELLCIYRPESVLAASNFRVGLPAWVAASRLHIPFYNEVRGFWELSRDAREPGYASSTEGNEEADRDAFVARQAAKVFTLNYAMKNELIKRGVRDKCIEIVSNGVSNLPDLLSPSSSLKKKLGIEERDKVIGYIGSFNPYEGLDVLLEACKELVQKGERIKLLLVGDSQRLISVEGSKKKFSEQTWLIQVGRVPYTNVADYYALLDVIVIPRKNLLVCNLVPPMKVAESLVYGKKLVVSDVAPLKEYADKYDGVVVFEAENSNSLVLTLQNILGINDVLRDPSALLMYHNVGVIVSSLRK